MALSVGWKCWEWWHHIYVWIEDIRSDDVTVWWHYPWVEDVGSDDIISMCGLKILGVMMSLFDGIICGLKMLGVMMSLFVMASYTMCSWMMSLLMALFMGWRCLERWCHCLMASFLGWRCLEWWCHCLHHIPVGWTCCFEGAGGTGYICLEKKILVGSYKDLISNCGF